MALRNMQQVLYYQSTSLQQRVWTTLRRRDIQSYHQFSLLRQHVCCEGVFDTEVSLADSWALNNRAAVLNLQVKALRTLIESKPEHAWMAVCEPDRLFALREVCSLLEADLETALQLVEQEGGLLDVPVRSLEVNMRGLQSLLQLPRLALRRLVFSVPALLVQGPAALEAALQQTHRDLELAAAKLEPGVLLPLVLQLGPDALLDPQVTTQQVEDFATALGLAPPNAVVLLLAEVKAGRDVQAMLSQEDLSALAREWSALSDRVQLPVSYVAAALAAQVRRPGARYLASSAPVLLSDITALHAACQLELDAVCNMLLAAPRLAAVPVSFWQLLLQYVLFLVPQWRQQLSSMSAAEAGCLLSQLFDSSGAHLLDVTPVSSSEAVFASADVEYNQELAVLEALLDQGLQAPRLRDPETLGAGRMWRLIYLCNPRLTSSGQQGAQGQADTSTETSSSNSSMWSWMRALQLPVPLVTQMQQRGVLSCKLPDTAVVGGSDAAAADKQSTAKGAMSLDPDAEQVESLSMAITADIATFVMRHPGYIHWLYNTAFELEWANSKAATAVATWDP